MIHTNDREETNDRATISQRNNRQTERVVRAIALEFLRIL